MSAFKVVLERESDGGYSVFCPALPGCASQGDTMEEALTNIQEAIAAYLEACEEEGRPVPQSQVN